jgi:iron(III) transport system ATP-binding protein
MDVFANASCPLRAGRRPLPRQAVEDKVMRVLRAVGLDALADRPATQLSGGQQQRLALARALVMEPRLLLLDEPLSNLDAKLRERMRFELKRLQRDLGITTVYVTHDQGEALALSDAIGVMNDGEVVQVGTPRAIYERPASRFVADFVGTTNFVLGHVVAHDDARPGHVRVDTEIGPLCAYAGDVLAPGDAVLLSIRPEDVELVAADMRGDNVRHGVIDQRVFLGEATDVHVMVGTRLLLARAHPRLAAQVGTAIGLALDPAKCVALKAAREPNAVA